MYESSKDTIAPPPSAEVIAGIFETITDEGSGDIRGCEANTIIYEEGTTDNCMASNQNHFHWHIPMHNSKPLIYY